MNSQKTKPSLALGSFSFSRTSLLIAITLLAFALRVIRLDFQPLWWDEGYSLFFATRDFGTLLERTAVDIHPPLYYALLQVWIAIAGKSDVAVRWLSVAIGVLTVPVIYALARKLFNRARIALIAACLLAMAPLHIYYSQEVRMYGLVTLLGLGSVYFFMALVEGRGNWFLWAAFILTTAAALYTQYYAAFIIVFEILVLVILSIRDLKLRSRFTFGSLGHWLIAFLAIAGLYLPWVVFAGAKLYAYVTFKVAHEAYAPQNPLTFFTQHLAAFSTGHLAAWTWLAWGSAAFVALALLGSLSIYRRDAQSAEEKNFSLRTQPLSGELCLLYLLVPLTLGYLVNQRFPFYPIRVERLLLLAAPAFYLLVAAGIETLWTRGSPVYGRGDPAPTGIGSSKHRLIAFTILFALTALSALSLYDFYTVPRYPDDDYRPLIAEMQTLAQRGDNFLAIYPWQIGYLESYYAGAPLTVIETPNDEWLNHPAQMQREVNALTAQQPRVWLPALQTLGHILEDSLDAFLRARTYTVIDTWFGTTRLELVAASDDPPPSTRVIAFENNFSVTHWGVSSSHSVVAGQGIIRVWFDWGGHPAPPLDVSLRLVDKKGNLWAQDDRAIESGVQRIGFAVPAGTPPGPYDLRLAIYYASDTRALHLANHSNQEDVLLASMMVEAPPQPNLAAIPHRTAIDFTNGIRFMGYDATAKPLKPGEPSAITLFWQSIHERDNDYGVTLQLQDARGNIYADSAAALARGIYPSSRWQPHELVRDPRSFTLRGDAPDGVYQFVVALIDPASQAHVKTTDGRDSISIGTVAVKGRVHYFGAPAPSRNFIARFDEVAQLVGYDLSIDPVRKNVRLVLYWQALAPTQTPYTVFAHLIDASGNLRAQRDQIPGAGEYPTTTWVKDEYLIDVYDISIASAPVGNYQIEIGMYDAETGARMPTFDASSQPIGDHSVLPQPISIAP